MDIAEKPRLGLWNRFKRCYEKRALDDVEEKIVGRAKRIAFSVRLLPTTRGRILDLGSADGLLLDKIGANEAIGSDISLGYCRKMKSRGIEVVNCAGEYVPFANETFDTIICTEVLEHVLYPDEVICEIHRVLRNEGYVFFSVPYLENITTYWHCKYEFAHLRPFGESFIHKLSQLFCVMSVSFYGFRACRVRIRSYSVSKIISHAWKAFASVIPNKLLHKFGRLRPLCMLVLVRKPKRATKFQKQCVRIGKTPAVALKR